MELNLQLIDAAKAGKLDAIKQALADGADIDFAEPDNFPALHYAMRKYPDNPKKPVLELVKFLVEKGASINKEYSGKETPFATACIEGFPEVVAYLYDQEKPDLNMRLQNGSSLLDELAIKLKDRPRNFTLTRTIDGEKVTTSDPDEIRRIMGSHPDDEANRYLDVARFLLEKGIDVNTKNPNKQGTIFTAGGADTIELIKLLIEHGAELNVKDEWGLTPLHYVCRKGFVTVAKMMIDAGADVNAQDGWGFTPLHEAALSNREEALKMLMSSGADSSIGLLKDYDEKYPKGTTAIQAAEKKGFKHLLPLLESTPKAPESKPPKQEIKGMKFGDEWRFNITPHRYDGVIFEGGELLWFTHANNPHAGGGASKQSFKDFLEKGPFLTDTPSNVVVALKEDIEKLNKNNE